MRMTKVVAGKCLCLSILWVLIISTVNPSSAGASGLTNPALGAADGVMGGNVVALPINAATALFHNPAQLSLLPNQMSMGLLGIRFHPSYKNNQGYDSRSRELPVAPNMGYVTDKFAPSKQAPSRFAPERSASLRAARSKLTFRKFILARFIPEKVTRHRFAPVSYTHLTLPTILRV